MQGYFWLILAKDEEDLCHNPKKVKIRQKYPCTVTEITYPPDMLDISPRWHMKYIALGEVRQSQALNCTGRREI